MYHVMACRSALFGPWYSHHTLLTDCWESKVVKQGGSGFFYMRVRACVHVLRLCAIIATSSPRRRCILHPKKIR